jgi:hypothetical protein
VSPVVALFAFAIGAAALAIWINVRFPRLAPAHFKAAFLHVGAAMLIAHVVTSTRYELNLGLAWPAGTLVHLFALLLPTIVYGLLAGLWFLKLAQGTLNAYR